MATHDHRTAPGGGLQDVVPAGGDERAPDEDDVGQRIDRGQLAQGIEQHHLLVAPASRLEPGAPHAAQIRCGHERRHQVEPLGVARSDEQGGVRHAFQHAAKSREDQLLFSHRGAARDDQRPLRTRDPPEAALQRFRRRRRLGRVELQIARDLHARARPTERADAFGMGLCLHQEEVDFAEHAADEAAQQPIARERAFREAPVDHGHPRSPKMRLVDEIRPDLALHEHEEHGVEGAESGPHRPRPVERCIEQAVRAHALRRDGIPRGRGGGEEDAQARKAILERRHERPRGEDLADRDRVDPHRPAARSGGRVGRSPHALAEGPRVLARGAALPEIERQCQDEAERQEDSVELVQVDSKAEVPSREEEV